MWMHTSGASDPEDKLDLSPHPHECIQRHQSEVLETKAVGQKEPGGSKLSLPQIRMRKNLVCSGL
jgi:hypothetical protein